jgi:hypothetical protein
MEKSKEYGHFVLTMYRGVDQPRDLYRLESSLGGLIGLYPHRSPLGRLGHEGATRQHERRPIWTKKNLQAIKFKLSVFAPSLLVRRVEQTRAKLGDANKWAEGETTYCSLRGFQTSRYSRNVIATKENSSDAG